MRARATAARRDDRFMAFRSVIEDIIAETLAVDDPALALARVRVQCQMRLQQIDRGELREITLRELRETARGWAVITPV